jgi:hypothetical protein
MDRKLFTSLLSKRLYPLLRAEGFRGSGATLRRMNEPVVEVFNVQASSGGHRCYLNLGLHLAYLPAEGGQIVQPGEFTESQCAFRTRLNPPPGQQFGWSYGSSQSEAESNVDRVLEAWEREGKPFFANHSYPGGVSRLVEELTPTETHPKHLLTFARIALQLGHQMRAIYLARSALERVNPSARTLKQSFGAFLRISRTTTNSCERDTLTPNPSVKGTKCGRPHFAPYLER